MAEYSVDYIKEKAKANYELIKILSLLSVSVGVGTISLFREADFSQGIGNVPFTLRLWIAVGVVGTTLFVVVAFYYVVSTNALLNKLNDTETE